MINPFHSNLSNDQISKVMHNFEEIVRSGQFILGKYNRDFEDICSDLVGTSFATTVSSGTVALECIFQYLFEERGVRSVGVQSNTNFATVSAIVKSGAEAVFIDCTLDGQLNIDIACSLICERKIDCVVAVHIGGIIHSNIDELANVANENNCFFVEDCAHAHGSIMNGRKAGSYGFASILSFFPTKLVNASEGGAICTNSERFDRYCKMWRNQGKSGTFGNDHAVLGGSYRLSEFNACLGIVSYSNLADEILSRSTIASQIEANIKSDVVISTTNHMDQFSGYKLIVRKSGLKGVVAEKALKELGVNCGGAVYRTPCHLQPVFKHVPRQILPITETFCEEHFCVPMHSGLTRVEADKIASAINTL